MAAWRLRGSIDGALESIDQFRYGAVQVPGNMMDGPPVPRFAGLDSDSRKQFRGGNVVGMGDKRDRHPRTDGFVFHADVTGPPLGPVAENKRTREG